VAEEVLIAGPNLNAANEPRDAWFKIKVVLADGIASRCLNWLPCCT
jgi:hypothetical protein